MSIFVIAIIYEILIFTPTLEIFNTKILFWIKFYTRLVTSSSEGGRRAGAERKALSLVTLTFEICTKYIEN